MASDDRQTDPKASGLVRLAIAAVTRRGSAQDHAIARESLVDTLACMRAGKSSAQVRRLSRALGPAKDPAAHALALGTAAHALDFDDYEEPGSTHPSAVLVPVLIALGSGGPLGLVLDAYLAGYETILALGSGLGYGHYMAGWHATATLGGLGAAVSAGRLLGLRQREMAQALAQASTRMSGLKRHFGSDTKALHAGLAARNGIEAALLAGAGLSARIDAFDGDFGVLALFGTDTSPGLPARFPTIQDHPPFRKAAPSCGYTLRAIDCAAEIAGSVDPTEIGSVRIEMPAPYHDVASFTAPQSSHEARFSVTWCVAVALANGGAVTPRDFLGGALADDRLRALEARCAVTPYPLAPGLGDMSAQAPDRVTVTLAGGRQVSASCAVPTGGPGRPFDRATLLGKARACSLPLRAARALLEATPADIFEPGAFGAFLRP